MSERVIKLALECFIEREQTDLDEHNASGDELRGRIQADIDEAKRLLASEPDPQLADLKRRCEGLVGRWDRRATLAAYDAQMAAPGSGLVAVHKHTASAVRECRRELEAILKGGE